MKIGTLLLAKRLAGKTRQRLQSAAPTTAATAAAAAAAAATQQPRARARRGSVGGLHAVDQTRGHRVLTQGSHLDAPDSARNSGSARALMVTAQHMHLLHDESAQHYSSTVRSAWDHLPTALKALKEASRVWRRELHVSLETAVHLLSACLAHDKSVAEVLSAYSAESSPVSTFKP
jgi:hypothetical protein